MRFDKADEQVTRKWLETQNDDEDAQERAKRVKVQDSRSQSKQNQSQSSSSGTHVQQEGTSSDSASAQEKTGTKRTSSKVSPDNSRNETGEPEVKRSREDEVTEMNETQNLNTAVYEFYSVPSKSRKV